jgi:hypothetical protein
MKKWYQVALLNLVVVTMLGLILRYKINFPLPFLEHKNILHAHSHFAFSGWVSFLLQLLIIDRFTDSYQLHKKQWDRFFTISTIVNYAMIISFAWQGYAGLSIFFSTVGLWLSYYFSFKIYRSFSVESRRVVSHKFIIAALFFQVLSSFGPYALALFIATKNTHQYWSHNVLYFFLHFQYNGWFIFAVLGLLMKRMEGSHLFKSADALKFFYLTFATCLSSYLLTVLWPAVPAGVTVINIVTVVAQAVALIFLMRLLMRNRHAIFQSLPLICRWLYTTAIVAFFLKIVLQVPSAHPEIAHLAFGFRPIIIGYLHLIFLVLVSFFLLSELGEMNVIPLTHLTGRWGLLIFSTGVVLNEMLLGMQGLAAVWYIYLPAINKTLFIITIIMFIGASIIYQSSRLQQEAMEPLYRGTKEIL